MSDTNLTWGKPIGANGTSAKRWHIFEDGRSLCGSWLLPSGGDEEVSDDEEYVEGQDCKACCRKADPVEVPA